MEDVPRPNLSDAAARDAMAERRAHDALFCLFTLLYKIAQADGTASEGELVRIQDLLDHRFEIAREQQPAVKELVLSWEADFSFSELVERLRRTFLALVGPVRAHKAFLNAVEMMFMVAASDGCLHEREEGLIVAAAHVLGIKEEDLWGLRASYVKEADYRRRWVEAARRSPPPADVFDPARATPAEKRRHYARVLGLAEGASADEVRQAYRSAVRKYHPDRLQQMGEELIALAQQKTRQINEAYAWLKEQRGQP